jgi:hypothetical protein
VEQYCIKGQELLGRIATAVVFAKQEPNDSKAAQRAERALIIFNEHVKSCRDCADFAFAMAEQHLNPTIH